MLANGLAEGVISQMRADYSRVPYHRLQDAVADGFVALYRKLLNEDVSGRLAFVFKVAKNTLNKELERTPALVPLPADASRDALLAEAGLDSDDQEVRAIRREHALRYLLGIIESWTNGNLKQVMRLVIESGMVGEPLESAEVGERIGLNAGSVRVWKQRGLDRLAAHVESFGLELGDFDDELVVVDDDDPREDDLNE